MLNKKLIRKAVKELKREESRAEVKESLGLDLGNGFTCMSVFDGRKLRILESPTEGRQILSAVFKDPKTGETHCGADALDVGYDNPAYVCQHFKRCICDPETAYERRYFNATASAFDILVIFIRHLIQLALSLKPEWRLYYPQFGGTERPAEEFSITVTTTSKSSFEVQQIYDRAFATAGVPVTGFIAEPAAAVRYLDDCPQVRLQIGTSVLVTDAGTGTLDIVVMRKTASGWEQLVRATGDDFLGGADFTAAIAEDIGNEFGVNMKGAFDKYGFNLVNVRRQLRLAAMETGKAAEQAKVKLSRTANPIMQPVNLPKGRKVYKIDREKAAKLWAPLLERVRECVSHALDDSDLSFDQIDYVLEVGGTANLPGFHETIAVATGRDVADPSLIVCTQSDVEIANGAAKHGYATDDAASGLPSGLVLTLRNEKGEPPKHRLFIEPHQVIGADGFSLQHSSFVLDNSTAGNSVLEVRLAAVKSGEPAKLKASGPTYLDAESIIPHKPVPVAVDWPPGKHDVEIRIRVGRDRRVWMVVRPVDLPNVEPLSFELTLEEGKAAESQLPPLDVIFLLDVSGSMWGDKLAMLKRGARETVATALAQGWRVGIVRFPNGRNDPATLICALTQNQDELLAAIDSLEAADGTPTHAALECGTAALKESENAVGMLFTDGHPAYLEVAKAAAEAFKSQGPELYCVGIGEDVDSDELRLMASSPDHYFDARFPINIVAKFRTITAQLIEREATRNDTAGDADADLRDNLLMSDKDSADDKAESKYDDVAWNDIEGDEEEAA